MSVFSWFKTKVSRRGKAQSLYERGMSKAHNQDQHGAIADYSVAINLPDAPIDIVSMALFNRGLAQIAAGEFEQGVEDLSTVVDMEGAPPNVKKMAKLKLAKRNARSQRKS